MFLDRVPFVSPPPLFPSLHHPFFTLTGQLYDLLNQYFNEVCKNCHTTRPDVSLYRFIYETVSSPAAADTLNTAKDSGMSPVTSDSH